MRDQAVRDDLDIPLSADTPSYRRPRNSSPLDANTKRLLMIAGGIGGALLLAVGGTSLTGHRRTGVPIVEALPGPIRVKPENAGGLQVLGSDDGGTDDGTKAAMAPAPEAPDLQALRAEELRARLTRQREAQALDDARREAAEREAAAKESARIKQDEKAHAATSTANNTASPVASPGNAAQRVSLDAAAPVPQSAPRVPVADIAAPAAKLATLAPRATVAAPAATLQAVQSAGASQVQLAALATEQAAMAEWLRLSKRMPDLFGDRRPVVTKFDRDGRTFWRLRTSGFADTAQATAFCQRVREKGAGCSLATF